jgi:hypothetical protein
MQKFTFEASLILDTNTNDITFNLAVTSTINAGFSIKQISVGGEMMRRGLDFQAPGQEGPNIYSLTTHNVSPRWTIEIQVGYTNIQKIPYVISNSGDTIHIDITE